jgi:hypothetical protein
MVHPWYDDLLLLGDCDRHGRVSGAIVCWLEEALDFIEELEDLYG